jgi:hypothetical protein
MTKPDRGKSTAEKNKCALIVQTAFDIWESTHGEGCEHARPFIVEAGGLRSFIIQSESAIPAFYVDVLGAPTLYN